MKQTILKTAVVLAFVALFGDMQAQEQVQNQQPTNKELLQSTIWRMYDEWDPKGDIRYYLKFTPDTCFHFMVLADKSKKGGRSFETYTLANIPSNAPVAEQKANANDMGKFLVREKMLIGTISADLILKLTRDSLIMKPVQVDKKAFFGSGSTKIYYAVPEVGK